MLQADSQTPDLRLTSKATSRPTGQVTVRCAPYAGRVIALEPVTGLCRYVERKMEACGLRNVSAVAGILEEVPLADASVDAAILSNGSFGWNAEVELRELERVTRPGGTTLALAPCNLDNEGIVSRFRDAGYEDFTIEIPVMAKNRPSSRGCDSRPWLRSCRASG